MHFDPKYLSDLTHQDLSAAAGEVYRSLPRSCVTAGVTQPADVVGEQILCREDVCCGGRMGSMEDFHPAERSSCPV